MKSSIHRKKNGYKLHHVVRGWKQIRTHLNMWSVDINTNAEMQLLDESVFIPCYRKQVTDIHVVAYLFHPGNYQVPDACLTLDVGCTLQTMQQSINQ